MPVFFRIEPRKPRPSDRPPEIAEIDTVDLVCHVEATFGISLSDRELEGINGSFDSIVQFLVRKCPPTQESGSVDFSPRCSV